MNNYALQSYLFSVGDKHSAVRTLKRFLISHPRVSTFNLVLDDTFDSKTQAAVAEYQRYKGLMPSGSMTGETYRAIGADMNGADVEIAVAYEPALRLLLARSDFGPQDDPSPGDGAGPLPKCAKNAILAYYKSVGNLSAEREKTIIRALGNVLASFTNFPITTPPGIARAAQSATDAVGGVGSYEKATGQNPMNIKGYTASATLIYFDDSIGGFPMYRTVDGLAILTHEFTHVMQYIEEKNFSINYVREMAKHGTLKGGKNRFEERAYINEAKSAQFYSNNQNLLCNDKYSN